MPDEKSFWKGIRRKKKVVKRCRRRALSKRIPLIREVCARAGIDMKKGAHGFIFRYGEYILSWSLSTNKVAIQYAIPGENRTVLFQRSGEPDKPRILVAIEELIDLVRAERLSRPKHAV